jgi:hypothetical protein
LRQSVTAMQQYEQSRHQHQSVFKIEIDGWLNCFPSVLGPTWLNWIVIDGATRLRTTKSNFVMPDRCPTATYDPSLCELTATRVRFKKQFNEFRDYMKVLEDRER